MTESKLKIFALSLVTLLFSFIIFFHPRTIRENEDRKAINQLTDENLTQKSVIQNEINVFCFIKNENVLQTCTKIASLLSNVSEKKIFVYLVHFSDEKITPQNVDKLNSINSIRDFNLEFVSLEKQYIKNIDLFGHETDVLIKLYAPELFPHLKKILWLGNDIIVNDEISELYERDLSDKYIAGVDVSFYYSKYCFNNFDIKLWVNSGILLYDLENMRRDNIQSKFLKQIKKYPAKFQFKKEGGSNLTKIDEYALSSAINRNKILLLPYRYCILPFLDDFNKSHFEDEEDEIKKAIIVNFEYCNKNKKENMRDYFCNILIRYC